MSCCYENFVVPHLELQTTVITISGGIRSMRINNDYDLIWLKI